MPISNSSGVSTTRSLYCAGNRSTCIAQIDSCRICGNSRLESVLDLGMQSLTGVFPKLREEAVEQGPIELVKCHVTRRRRPLRTCSESLFI